MKRTCLLFVAAALAASLAVADATAAVSGRTVKKPTTAGKRMVIVNPDGSHTPIGTATKRADVVAMAYEWTPELAPAGPVSLDIVLNEQRIYVYRAGIQIGYSIVSTGREGYNTPAGNYKVLQKEIDHRSTQFGSFVDTATGHIVDSNAIAGHAAPPGTRYEAAPMPYFQRLTWGGVGLHEGFLPGFPASHGCIRVHPDMAHRLFEVTTVGTPVRITYDRTPPQALPP